ncbi:hypothetical protein ACFLSX_04005 [Calditrichota bacterium]
MIQESQKILNLKQKYIKTNIVDLPSVLYREKFGNLKKEIKLIDKILSTVDLKVAEKWMNDFLSSRIGQHWGGWLEIRLFDWLRKIGNIEIEPNYLGDLPDFKVEINKQNIFIEAKSFIKTVDERRKNRAESYLNKILEQVDHPVLIKIEEYEFGSREIDENIVNDINKFIPEGIGKSYKYNDKFGNKVKIHFEKNISSNKPFILGPSGYGFINTDLLKKPLKEKSKQHSVIHKSGNIYLIAIFIESSDFSGQDIVDAWFGKTKIAFDPNTLQVVSTENDLSGLHFGRSKIFHTTVSGTIVFKVSGFSEEGFRIFKTWFIQNPYSSNPVNIEKFSVDRKFVVLNVKENKYEMGWA